MVGRSFISSQVQAVQPQTAKGPPLISVAYALSMLVAALMAIASAAGLFAAGSGIYDRADLDVIFRCGQQRRRRVDTRAGLGGDVGCQPGVVLDPVRPKALYRPVISFGWG